MHMINTVQDRDVLEFRVITRTTRFWECVYKMWSMCKREARYPGYTAGGALRQKRTHTWNDTSDSHVCYGPTGQWTVTKGSRGWTAALMKGAEGHSQAYVTYDNTCARTHIRKRQCSTERALFGLFIWTQEKGKGLCISHCAQRGSYTGPEPRGRVTTVTMCCGVCVRRSFFRIKCSLLVLPVCDTDISRKAEEQTMS